MSPLLYISIGLALGMLFGWIVTEAWHVCQEADARAAVNREARLIRAVLERAGPKAPPAHAVPYSVSQAREAFREAEQAALHRARFATLDALLGARIVEEPS